MKYFFKISLIILTLLISGYTSELQSKPSQTLVNAQTLKAWGYQNIPIKQREPYSAELCNPLLMKNFKGSHQSIKSLKPLPQQPDTYYRYTLIEAIYPNELEAKRAAEEFLPGSSLNPNKKRYSIMESKSCLILEGFQKGEKLYLVHTDVSMFSGKEQKRILEKFKTSLTTRTLTRHLSINSNSL